jgi:hypothetical protein
MEGEFVHGKVDRITRRNSFPPIDTGEAVDTLPSLCGAFQSRGRLVAEDGGGLDSEE